MKEIIEQSGMTIREFSEFYEIPYNTVRLWKNGERKAPKWAVKLLKEKIERDKKGTQMEMKL